MDALVFIVIKFFGEYWPHVVLVVSVVASITAAVHAAMTKQDVRAAIGWVAVIMFSPLFGAFFYFIAGINRIRKKRISTKRKRSEHPETQPHVSSAPLPTTYDVSDLDQWGLSRLKSMQRLGDQVALFPLVSGNAIELLDGGDQTYPAMIKAIDQAQHSVALQSYIFDHDRAGLAVAQALIRAQKRGVQVRVLIDSVGSRYSRPPIVATLEAGSVNTALFMATFSTLRLAYANLRSHRKLLIVDGRHGLTGGMNIRESFMQAYAGSNMTHDTHFAVQGPVVGQLFESFAHDWEFTTGEHLQGPDWYPENVTWSHSQNIPIRAVRSGPDRMLGNNQSMLLGALSIAARHVRMQSPYFLPDVTLIAALKTAARRGVVVDVIIPGQNNLKLVSAAMDAQLDQIIEAGVRVWRSGGAFDHSKLCTVDDEWSFVGSTNIDSRSLRLNFELDIEIYDVQMAQALSNRMDRVIRQSQSVTLKALKAKPFIWRLRDKVVWLASPYL